MKEVYDLALEAWEDYRQIYDRDYSQDESIFTDGFRGGWFAALKAIEKGLARKLPGETLDELLRMTEKKP